MQNSLDLTQLQLIVRVWCKFDLASLITIKLHFDALPCFTAINIKPATYESFVLGELSCEWQDVLLENSN